jgi:hypothetical protein
MRGKGATRGLCELLCVAGIRQCWRSFRPHSIWGLDAGTFAASSPGGAFSLGILFYRTERWRMLVTDKFGSPPWTRFELF